MSPAVEAFLARLKGVKRTEKGWEAKCPAHDDRHASLTVSEGNDGRVLVRCHAGSGCSLEDIVAAAGTTVGALFVENGTGPNRTIVATYDYEDAEGALLFQVVRYESKRFVQRRPDGRGGWVWKLGNTRRVLYRLPQLLEGLEAGRSIHIAEGEKDVQALEAAGEVATCNPMGAGKWRDTYSNVFRGADVVIVRDRDEVGAEHAAQVSESLAGIAASVRIVEAAEGKDAADHLAAGRTVEEFVAAVEPEAESYVTGPAPLDPKATIATVLEAIREYLDVAEGEEAFIVASLATAVSKALVWDEPLWLILVGASGGGKTEAIKLLAGVAEGRVDELTRAGLLSWAPGKKPKAVGLLMRIPPSSLVTISDFSTVVTMGDREARARMFGMLRVVYDGRVYRSIGGQPAAEGDELVWEGHLTLIAGATPVVDTHTAFEGALGERWLMLRLPESNTSRARERARFVVRREDVSSLREVAQAKARALVLASRERIPARLSEQAEERLITVATFVALVRTGIVYEGTGKNRVITGIPTPEEPTRLAGQLTRLARCGVALGLEEADAVRLAVTAAVDSVPLARIRALRAVADHPLGATVEEVRRRLGRANWYVAKWELDALETIGLAVWEVREINGFEQPIYRLYEPYRVLYGGVYTNVAFSQTPTSNEEKPRGAAYGCVDPPNPLLDGFADEEIPL
jgi:hypothetical protein